MAFNISEYRYERKYLTQEYTALDLENFVLSSQGMFSRVFYPRIVSSIYFDTPDLDYYNLNLIGASERKKVRARWYLNDDQNKGFVLEIKQKDGDLNRKLVKKLSLNERQVNFSEICSEAIRNLASVLPEASSLEPILMNAYLRRYYLSRSLGIRITIDEKLSFRSLVFIDGTAMVSEVAERLVSEPEVNQAVILECKFSNKSDDHLSRIINSLPIRVTKSSKYVMGVSQVMPE